jgi:mRNA-degrading endonuclease YafQ of YafQ-DinJ toxin-antitoxin module
MVNESGVEDLMMGNVSEDAGESQEAYNDRIREAQAKMAQAKKDEDYDRSFDKELSEIIKNIKNEEVLNIIIFLLDNSIPSLTILATIGIVNDKSIAICWNVFSAEINEKDKEGVMEIFREINNEEYIKRISYWLLFLSMSDSQSKTTKLAMTKNAEFQEEFKEIITSLLKSFIAIYEENNDTKLSAEKVQEIVNSCENKIF